jgi:hypothetical protein
MVAEDRAVHCMVAMQFHDKWIAALCDERKMTLSIDQ